MKSRTSLFNKELSLFLFRRFFIIWAAYLAALIFILPAYMLRLMEWSYNLGREFYVYDSAAKTIPLSFITGICSAMAVFSYLYSPKGSGMAGALPVKRETMFITSYLTGLIPMIAADIIMAAVSLAMGIADIKCLMLWLGVTAMGNILFYSVAVFCAVLTGNIVVLPLLYVAVNFTGSVVQNCVRHSFSKFVWGMPAIGGSFLGYLTPYRALWRNLGPVVPNKEGAAVTMSGVGLLGIYCLIAIALSGAAFMIYRKRHMECAGDAVAVSWLRPVFKYCMAVGTALVFSNVISSLLPQSIFHGTASAVTIMLLMWVGAFLGYYAGEMLLQKSFAVFPGRWKEPLAVCALMGLIVMGFEFDVFRYERHIPAADRLEKVVIDQVAVVEKEDIEAFTDFTRQIAADKNHLDKTGQNQLHYVHYYLKNGRDIRREYYLPYNGENAPDPISEKLNGLFNRPNVIMARNTPRVEVNPENISSAMLIAEIPEDGNSYLGYTQLILTPEEAVDFYYECIVPDLKAGKIGRSMQYYGNEYQRTMTNVSVEIGLVDKDLEQQFRDNGSGDIPYWDNISLRISIDSENCLEWIKTHTEIEPKLLYTQEQYSTNAEGCGMVP